MMPQKSDDGDHRCGPDAEWYYDARGIELFKGCARCAPAKLRRYRPEVLSDPNYEASEDIEED